MRKEFHMENKMLFIGNMIMRSLNLPIHGWQKLMERLILEGTSPGLTSSAWRSVLENTVITNNCIPRMCRLCQAFMPD